MFNNFIIYKKEILDAILKKIDQVICLLLSVNEFENQILLLLEICTMKFFFYFRKTKNSMFYDKVNRIVRPKCYM